MTSSSDCRTKSDARERPLPEPRPRTPCRRRMILQPTIMSALVLTLAVVLVPMQPAGAVPGCPIAIAHRGNAFYGGPTENSIGAFNATFDAGGKWIETDVQFTSDAVPVLMHDSTVDRTTSGSGSIASMTAHRFTALTMNDGQHPPTLDQALDLCAVNPTGA
jgi:hypothetical protein